MFSNYEKSDIIAGCSIYRDVTPAPNEAQPQSDGWGSKRVFPEKNAQFTRLKIPVSVYEEMPHFILGYN
jgi:hypothetical protein